MEEEDRLFFIEQCLKKFEYPNIYGVNMSEIFGVSNRKFLLSWLYSLVHGSSTNEIFPDEVLCEFLNWFSKSSQVKGILEADMEYPVQLKILYRIFKSLDSIKTGSNNENFIDISLHDTKNLCDKEINIFKNFGPIKISDDDIVEMAKLKDSPYDNCDMKNENEEYSSLKLKSEKLIQMESNVKSATSIVSKMLRNVDNEDLVVNFHNNDVKLFRVFNGEVENGKRYIKNVESLSQFNEELNNFSYEIPVSNSDESIRMAKEVVRLIHDINNM